MTTATPSPLSGERRQVKPYNLHGVLTALGAIRATGETHYKGWLLGRDTSGKLDVVTERPDLTGAGYAEKDELAAGDGVLDGNAIMYPDSVLMAVGEEFVESDAPCIAYGVSNQEVGKGAYGAANARSPIGIFLGLDNQDATRAIVWLGSTAAAIIAGMLGIGATGRMKARAVATSIAAYAGTGTAVLTASATGAIGAQDGVTLVAGDVVFVQEGTSNVTACDAGPWVVANPGATGVKYILVRPRWWRHGDAMDPGAVIQIGGEGTGTDPQLAGSEWKCFVAKGKVIGTDAPVFWPRMVSCAVTLASGTLASARRTIPVRDHTRTSFVITSDPATAPHASTRAWRISALTVGVTGTASVQMVAESAPGTTNASDVGQYNIAGINW